jgi:hypothetical protein
MHQINVFLFVLSIIHSLRYLVEFGIKFFQEEPTPMEINEIEKTILYFTSSYIITYFLI